MNLELENKIVVITGATGGIGSQIAKDFIDAKSVVVCLIRNENKFIELRKSMEAENLNGSNLHFVSCNLSDYSEIKNSVAQITEKFSRIDILVHCAGYTEEQPFALFSDKQISDLIDINLKGPVLLTHAVLKTMFKQNSGSIIFISSASTIKKGRGIVAYASAKAGLETFTRALAQEVGRKKIRVNCIRPGVIETGMSSAVIYRNSDKIIDFTSLGRTGKPNEISNAVLFIASEKAASYLTGECITIDGGMY